MAEKENFVLFSEIHSEEVHEIIGTPPHWLVQWGITLFFALSIIVMAACWLIRYPDVIPVPFTLTASNPPRILVVRNEGKLAKLLTEDGELVKSGQLLGIIESSANAEHILALERELKSLNRIVRRGQWETVKDLHLNRYGELGQIQNVFQTFTLELSELQSFLDGGFYLQKRKLLLKDINDLILLQNNLNEQVELQQRDYQLGKEEFEMQELLFKQKVISQSEFKHEKAKLLGKEFPLRNLSASLIQNTSAQTQKQRELLELDNSIFEKKNAFLQTLQNLQSSIASWKQNYVLEAPVSGRISFSGPWKEQQYLVNGQELLTIEPVAGDLKGIVKIPQVNLGKIRLGQQVLIKLDGYPYREFGIVEGELTKLSQTPGRDSLYWGYIALPDQLETKYHRKLNYRNGMKGTAEIVTTNKRLAERLLSIVSIGR